MIIIRIKGFTLIELMTVVVIASILATIAIPAYTNQVIKSRRAEATSLLMNIASRQQRFFTNRGTYTTDITGTTGLNASTSSANNWYIAGVAASTTGCPIASCYLLEAVPQSAQVDDDDCKTFTLKSDGTQGVKGSPSPTLPAAECW